MKYLDTHSTPQVGATDHANQLDDDTNLSFLADRLVDAWLTKNGNLQQVPVDTCLIGSDDSNVYSYHMSAHMLLYNLYM